MVCVAVKNKVFQFVMCIIKYCSTRGFINASGFHSNQPVFNKVNLTHSVSGTYCIKRPHEFDRIHSFTVYGNRVSIHKIYCNVLGFIGSFLNGVAYCKDPVKRFLCRILKFVAFMGQVPEVAVFGIDFLFCGCYGNASFIRKVYSIFP